MRAALEDKCLASLRPTRPRSLLEDAPGMPVLRPLRRPHCDAPATPLFSSGYATSRRPRHTLAYSAATLPHLTAHVDVGVGGPRRPRRAAPTRLFTPPRTALPSAGLHKIENVAVSSSAQNLEGGTQSSDVASAPSLSTRLRRSHLLAACPLLYTLTLSTFVAETLSATVPGRLSAAERQLSLLTTDIGGITRGAAGGVGEASWSVVALPVVQLLCRAVRRGEAMITEALFVRCLTQMAASTDAATETAVAAMVHALLAHWSTCAAPPSASHVELTVRSVVESASAVLLPAVVEALQVWPPPPSLTPTRPHGHGDVPTPPATAVKEPPLRFGSQTADNLHGGRRWHPTLSESSVKVCLYRLSQLLTTAAGVAGDRRRDNDTPTLTTPALRHRLQCCCLCQLPPLLDERTRHDCAVLTMTALKNAAFPDLVATYLYFGEEGMSASVPVALRFLMNCGTCVPNVTQNGVSLSVYVAAGTLTDASAAAVVPQLTDKDMRSFIAPRSQLAPLLHARSTLLHSGGKLQHIEGGLVHLSGVLNALGWAAEVRALYATVQLRETPHSVMSLVRLHDVPGAVKALGELGVSRPEGWVFVPPAVVQCMEAVSRLVGVAGTPALVDALYVALVGFHNGSFFTSYYIELVLAGVCDRIRDVCRIEERSRVGVEGLQHRATPHEVLARVIPVVRATLRYVGDELNADMILEVVETALHVDDYAVSLTAALVWAFRAWMELSLCLQELLCRVDASTHNVPFLQYYALCYARDFCRSTTFDHLAALWHVDGDAVWHRASHLSPSCQLWKCAACGRLNSDRYNYCLCSALRYSHVVCGACGYMQDERLRYCRSCGTALLSKAALAGAAARKAWQCGDCGARNPAKQTLKCFRCGHATGPRFTAMQDGSGLAPLKSLCDCHTSGVEGGRRQQRSSEAAYAAAVGVCRSCGTFKMDYAAHHSAVWVCVGCSQRRSTLERLCPACPQVECLPHAVCRESLAVPRVCVHCQHKEGNPFTVVCAACGSSDEPLRIEAAAPTSSLLGAGSTGDSASGAVSAAPLDVDVSSCVLHWCFRCHHVQEWKESSQVGNVYCESCGTPCEERGRCTLPPRTCGHCAKVLPARHGGAAICSHCATYVAPPARPVSVATSSGGGGGDTAVESCARRPVVWNAVTLLHTCEVLDDFCAREARIADDTLHSATTAPALIDAAEHNAFLARRPTLERTLTRLSQEWTSTRGDGGGVGVAVWLPLRMDVATVLGRALNRLRQHIPFSVTARRLSALLKGILTHIDALCGIAATGCRDVEVGRYNVDAHFTHEELCRSCLGTHPAELCPFRDDGGRWVCAECDFSNDNSDVARYVCAGCLALRPVVQDLLVSTCWECCGCRRANVQFERYCIHCGQERDAWRADLLPVLANGTACVYGEGNADGDDEKSEDVAAAAAAQLVSAERADELPFTPAKCHLCGLVYIEARCPLCENHIPDVADAQGVVCEVQTRHAFIQPFGTSRRQDRILVEEALLQAVPLREGLEVRYTAELGSRGRMKATFLRP